MLIDMGNGVTYWADLEGATGTYASIAGDVAAELGLGFSSTGGAVTTIGEMTNHAVGGSECVWTLYLWDGSVWVASDDTTYAGGSFAWGFYSDPSITPVDTSGYVDSAIIVAGGYLYHTTGGAYGNSGADGNPWVYCLNRFTGDVVWSFMMTKGQGYEVTSPLVVGDMLIVTATNWNVYCFDRFTGDVLDTVVLEPDFPYDENMDVAWDGRTFFTRCTIRAGCSSGLRTGMCWRTP